jgi:murein DD-endopeptidase MepM/ murein hydrolase activator NlpD
VCAATAFSDDGGFHVARASVEPRVAYFANRKPVTLRYLFHSRNHPRDVTVRVVRLGDRKVVVRWRRRGVEPGSLQVRRWRGRAGDGTYAFRIGSPGLGAELSEPFDLHGHRFPVKGGHGTRGAIGDFGAPRAGGRVHEGFDVTAPCGTPLLAIRAGRVERVGYDPQLYGHFVEVDARESRLDYFYAHLLRPASASRGDAVKTSERLGRVGLTGNAAGTPCHLHVELRRSGRLVDPEPALVRWDRYG